MSKKNKNIVTWNYDGDADITIGDVKVSNLPKILLALLLILLIGGGIATYYFQDVIYDFIVKPEVILKEEEIKLNVGEPFDANEYIAKLPGDGLEPDRYEITIPENRVVNVNKVGDYRVVYSVKVLSNDKIGESELLVHVVDEEPPVITLSTHNLELIRNKDEFKCLDYLESVKDNYDTTPDWASTKKLTCTDNIDWSADSYIVSYVATDDSGNIATENLEIKIKNEPKPSYQCWDGTLAWSASGCPARPQQQNSGGSSSNSPSNNSSNSGGNSSSSPSGGNSNSGGSSSYSPPASDAPYINCPSCSVAVGDFGALTGCLSGTSSNRTISLDYSGVNLSTPGSYSVSVSAVDGSISTSCGVTVHE